jgi:hypothetical protein
MLRELDPMIAEHKGMRMGSKMTQIACPTPSPDSRQNIVR